MLTMLLIVEVCLLFEIHLLLVNTTSCKDKIIGKLFVAATTYAL